MVYLAEVNRGRTLAASIHGENDIANTLFSTCFHTMHLKCYFGLEGDPTNLNCPLCGKFSNCIVPAFFENKMKKLNRICYNVMISSMIKNYKLYDIESYFMLAARHLVESMGLNSLLSFMKYKEEKSFRRKVNDFVWAFFSRLYEEAPQEQKVIYKN